MAECHHPRCERTVTSDYFACRAHWFQLPVTMRERIWSTWRAIVDGVADGATLEQRARVEAEARDYWLAHPS